MKAKQLLIITLSLLLFAIVLMLSFGKKPSLSTQKQQTQQLANPASVNCVKKGGTLEIKTNGTGGQYGLCMFEDNMACEEWALFRGDCPVGGVKTTGYDNIEQSYCAWVGGKTLAVSNATCTLPNGKVCSDKAVYNGTCQ
jgi:putative hemolysin